MYLTYDVSYITRFIYLFIHTYVLPDLIVSLIKIQRNFRVETRKTTPPGIQDLPTSEQTCPNKQEAHKKLKCQRVRKEGTSFCKFGAFIIDLYYSIYP